MSPKAAPVVVAKPKARKPKSAAKAANAPSHSTYLQMALEAVKALQERGGSSRVAMVKFISSTHSLDANKVNKYLKSALNIGVASGALKQVKGKGTNGSFKLGNVKATPTKPRASNDKPEKEPATKVAAKSKAKSPAKAKTPVKAKSPAKAKAAAKAKSPGRVPRKLEKTTK